MVPRPYPLVPPPGRHQDLRERREWLKGEQRPLEPGTASLTQDNTAQSWVAENYYSLRVKTEAMDLDRCKRTWWQPTPVSYNIAQYPEMWHNHGERWGKMGKPQKGLRLRFLSTSLAEWSLQSDTKIWNRVTKTKKMNWNIYRKGYTESIQL